MIELDLGFTFLTSARLSGDSGHTAHQQQALGNARAACKSAAYFLLRLPDADAGEFQHRLKQLREALAFALSQKRLSTRLLEKSVGGDDSGLHPRDHVQNTARD